MRSIPRLFRRRGADARPDAAKDAPAFPVCDNGGPCIATCGDRHRGGEVLGLVASEPLIARRRCRWMPRQQHGSEEDGDHEVLHGNRGIIRRMATQVGRNAPCPCGSGRKFKQCHGAGGGTRMSLGMRIAILAVAGAIVSVIVFGLTSFDTEPEQAGIWSAEHGHYH